MHKLRFKCSICALPNRTNFIEIEAGAFYTDSEKSMKSLKLYPYRNRNGSVSMKRHYRGSYASAYYFSTNGILVSKRLYL